MEYFLVVCETTRNYKRYYIACSFANYKRYYIGCSFAKTIDITSLAVLQKLVIIYDNFTSFCKTTSDVISIVVCQKTSDIISLVFFAKIQAI